MKIRWYHIPEAVYMAIMFIPAAIWFVIWGRHNLVLSRNDGEEN